MTDRENRYRTLIQNAFLIGVGTFGSKIPAFLMVRSYTDVLSPAGYGTADLIMQTANLLIPVVSMGMTNGVFRIAPDLPVSTSHTPHEVKEFFAGGKKFAVDGWRGCSVAVSVAVNPLNHVVYGSGQKDGGE